MLSLTVKNQLVPHYIWGYGRGVVLTDNVTTGFDCICFRSCAFLNYPASPLPKNYPG